MLTNECVVIGHYPDNADTCYFELRSIIPNVNDYEQFERELDSLRVKQFDFDQIAAYMNKHYTSTRAEMLVNILKKHSISIL